MVREDHLSVAIKESVERETVEWPVGNHDHIPRGEPTRGQAPEQCPTAFTQIRSVLDSGKMIGNLFLQFFAAGKLRDPGLVLRDLNAIGFWLRNQEFEYDLVCR